MDRKTQNHMVFAFLYKIISPRSTNVNRFEFDEAGAPNIGAPALSLFFIAVVEQVGEAACDIVHFSLFIRIIGMAVHVKSCEEVAVTCVILYLLYRERCIIGEEADTGVPEFVKSYVRKFVFVEEFYEVMCYTVRRY